MFLYQGEINAEKKSVILKKLHVKSGVVTSNRLLERLGQFGEQLVQNNMNDILEYFDSEHLGEQYRLYSSDHEYTDTSDERFVSRYVIETLSLYGENHIDGLHGIARIRYTSITRNNDGNYTVYFTLFLDNGEKVKGSFFIKNASLQFYGAFG